jgi:GTPase SAR1 family protein
MFDLTARETLRSVNKWKNDIKKVEPNVHIVLVGNKCDSSDSKIKTD